MNELLHLIRKAAQQNIDWSGLEEVLLPFVASLSRTEQNPLYHGEGDVWTHTRNVCEALITLDSYQGLSAPQREAVFLAALLHDVGKIPTTRWEDGRWKSPNHALVGSKMARRFMWQTLGLCGSGEKQRFRETVCGLIRYHAFPPNAIDDPEGRRKLLSIAANGELCPLFTPEILCVLSEADALGRESRDKAQLWERVMLCREMAEENGCLHAPFPFPTEHTEYAYLSGKNILPDSVLYDDTWEGVILVAGLPGTGKDTWIRENCPELPVISLDDIRKEMNISPTGNQRKAADAATERAKVFLRSRTPFVWNATNISPELRGRQLRLFHQYHAAVRLVWLETEWNEQLRRNSQRKEAVPQQAICRMMDHLSLPERREAHRVQWHCV